MVRYHSLTLGQMIFNMSQLDPMLNRWAERINGNREKGMRRNGLASVAGADAASGSVGTTPPVQADVSEIYSPPRVTIVAAKTGLNPGSAMDLRTGYDFTRKADQDTSKKMLRKDHVCL